MTRSRWLVAVLLLGALVVGLTGLSAAGGPDLEDPGRADHVVVVGVAGLSWDDITPTQTPNLWAAANRGAVALLSTRAARSVTCPWDGWVTLGAGNRARYPAPVPEDDLPPAEGELPGPADAQPTSAAASPSAAPDPTAQDTAGCLNQVGTPPTLSGSQLAPVTTENGELGFGAEPGLLGTSVACTSTVGDAPVLAVGAPTADVRPVPAETTADGWNRLAGRCPLLLVQTATPTTTPAGLRDLDKALGPLIEGTTRSGGTLMIAGIAQNYYEPATLHPLIALGPGLGGKLLSSPSTGRVGFTQLIDLAPTTLQVLGQSAPSAMTGQPVSTVVRTESLSSTVAGFVEAGNAATFHLWVSKRFFNVFTIVLIAGCVFGFLAVTRFPRLRPAAGVVGIVVGLVPLSGYLANALPWWRFGSPGLAVSFAILASVGVTSVVALAGPWRRWASGPPLVAGGLTAGVLAYDVLTGSYLQLNSPLGYDAIVAGRFTGFGNIAYAVFAAGGLLCVAAAARLAGWNRRDITAVVAILGVALVVLDGAPGVGSDFGGVVALVPALLLLWMMVARVRISVARLVGVLALGGVVVVGFAVVDYLRPERSQTHLGRFVGQVLDGTAWTVITRKLSANLNLLTSSILTVAVLVFLALAVLLWLDRSGVVWAYVRDHSPYAAAGLTAVGVVALVGFAVNDSGIALTAAAFAVALPLLLSAAARGLPPPPLVPDSGPPSASGPPAGDLGVSVESRR